MPFGAGSSVVWGVNPPDADAVVTVAMDRFDRVLDVDATSRAARIQAGVYGPALEDQLRPHGFTLRHFPQSFRFSTLGGWIATRSGGHYATNHTHIDDFVESVRMLTPQGWWESRRLPGSGAGPSPDRMVIGSEGILGVITEAWMRVQQRPTFRATAGIVFPTWDAGTDAVRQIVQAKLWPANCRILDPVEAERAAGLDGTASLVIVSFESAEHSQRHAIGVAVDIARGAGGVDRRRRRQGRRWSRRADRPRRQRRRVARRLHRCRPGRRHQPRSRRRHVRDGDHVGPLARASTPRCVSVYRARSAAVFGTTAELSCRFTHVYPDGPAPYYTWFGMGQQGSEIVQWAEVKAAASEAVLDAGGTITHHHAVGRMHRPQYDRQRPDLFADALRAAKQAVDPAGMMNPGVLIDPA